MARDRTALALARIAELRDAADSAALHGELAEHLGTASGSVVAAAARAIAERGIQSLEGALVASFARLLAAAAKGDPQCVGKRALAKTLVELRCGVSALDVYRAGVRHVQLEPVFGGKVDTAVELRAICAQGLVLANPADLWLELADLLSDREATARAGAVRAIAFAGNAFVGAPLLRMRVRCGDPDVRVLGDCFVALLEIDAVGSLGFVGAYLDDANAAIAEAAALGLGESRSPQALELLQAWLARCMDPELQGAGYTAVALLRSDAATDFLLAQIRDAPARRACLVVSALGMHGGDEKLRARVESAVAERNEREVRDAFREAFG